MPPTDDLNDVPEVIGRYQAAHDRRDTETALAVLHRGCHGGR